MKKWLFSLVAVPALLFGCAEEEPVVDTIDSGVMPVAIDVAITSPATFNAKETVELSAHVTQGEEAVNDADEVKFEIWESGMRDMGEMLDGTLTEEGTYKVDYTFDHDGVYYMFAHTTARGLHMMPKQEIIVGNPDMGKVLEDTSSNSMNHGNQEMDESEDGHGQTEESDENHNH
ncbi:FixH family protein [Solibacillus sp. FSL H8-0538]|uniref:FixH family protein n=1 Tax=Solibacillus sp. FSL H8-0538 TaxID=2921400 RepID=UPI0030F630CC